MNTNDSATQLIYSAMNGLLTKDDLAQSLDPELRSEFLQACEEVEKAFTRACAANGDFCLASGCALEGESCLNALLKAGPDFNKACADLWAPLFRSSQHPA